MQWMVLKARKPRGSSMAVTELEWHSGNSDNQKDMQQKTVEQAHFGCDLFLLRERLKTGRDKGERLKKWDRHEWLKTTQEHFCWLEILLVENFIMLLIYCFRVHLGFLNDFVSTSCVTDLTFLSEQEDSPDCKLF